MPFDFEIVGHSIIIELDGQQHFEQVMEWQSAEATRKKDFYKQHSAIINGYRVIRLTQRMVWRDTSDWEDVLFNHINRMMANPRETGTIYISTDDIYDRFINEFASYRQNADSDVSHEINDSEVADESTDTDSADEI
jgi:hypothetical protein